MPIYEYRCPQGHVFTAVKRMALSAEPEPCQCGLSGDRVILSPPRVFGDYEGYESPASGKWIEGRRARKEDLLETGCRPYDPGEKELLKVRKAEEERKLDNLVDEAVDMTLATMGN